MLHSDSAVRQRSFQDMHRDFWKLISANPVVFLLLPALAYLPVDLISEYLTSGQEALQAIRNSQRINQIATALIGTYLAGVTLVTLKLMTEGVRPSLSESLRLGRKEWGVISMTSISAGWRIGLGFLFFVIPGIILSCRYVFALPVTVFESVHSKNAISRSTEIAKGQQFRIFKLFTYPILIYLPLIIACVMGVSYLIPDDNMLLLKAALTGLPINIALACTSFGLGFSYLELCRPDLLEVALQKSAADQRQVQPGLQPLSTAPLPWPWLVGLGSWTGIFAVVYFVVGLGTFPLLVGAMISEKKPAKAVEMFDMAIELEPLNSEIRLSVGTHLLNFPDMLERSVTELEKAVELAPEHGEAHLFLSIAQLTAGNIEVARSELALAEKYGVESEDILATVQANFDLTGSEAEGSEVPSLEELEDSATE